MAKASARTANRKKTKTASKRAKVAKRTKMPKRKKVKAKAKTKTKAKAKKTTAKKTSSRTKKATAKKGKTATRRTSATRSPMKARPIVSAEVGTMQPAAIEQVATNRVQKGDMAPDFALPDQNGDIVRLSDLRGRIVVLYFYPKDDTPGCTKEACSFRDNLPTFEGVNATILGVSFDDARSHQNFIQKYGLNFPLLSDTDKETAKAYGVYVQKNMYGNLTWGIERSTFVIDREGRIAEAFRRVSVDGHTDQVLEVVRSLQ